MAEEGAQSAGPIRMVAIENMVESIRYKAQIIARTNKVDSAVSYSGLIGFTLGLCCCLVLVVLPALLAPPLG